MSENRRMSPEERRRRQEFINRKRRELKREKAIRVTIALLQLAAPFVAIFLVIFIVIAAIKGIIKKPENEVDSLNVVANEQYLTVSEPMVIVEEEPEVIDQSFKKHDPEAYGLFEGYKLDNSSPSYLATEDALSEYAVIIDAGTGKVIASRKGDSIIYPASMTKIMTLMVAVEQLESEDSLDDIVTISSNDTNYAYSHDLSIVGFSIGEKVTVRDLLYGTILPSGGDAAHALAVYIAGSEEAFADLMNEKINELGIASTCHFTNCSGIYNDNHYCTLLDMAIILKAAEENELCRTILGERKYTTSQTPEHPAGIEISNWFIRRIEDKDCHGTVLGAKTGFVKESGCNAASYQKSNDGHSYICVTVNAWSPWRAIYDHVAIYDTYTN